MTAMSAKEAAEKIKDAFASRPALPPEAHHAHAFAKEVCGHLGAEPDAVNVSHVLNLLHDEGVEAPVPQFPKMKLREATQEDVDAHRARYVGEHLPETDKHGNPVLVTEPEPESDDDETTAGTSRRRKK